MTTLRPYGSWASPITAALIVEKSIGLRAPLSDGHALYWSESRPTEGGRTTLIRWQEGEGIQELLPPPYSARSRVHEYGGGAITVHRSGIYFVNESDQRLYRLTGKGAEPITPEGKPYRYANCIVDERRHRLICVREDHTDPQPAGVVNTLVAIRLPYDPQGGEVLAEGHDFYAEPRLDPEGRSLAWLAWDHPRMPWDGTLLYVAQVGAEGGLHNAQVIAGGEQEAITQPNWDAQGRLYFISDRSNWWNLYRWDREAIRPLHPMAAEFAPPPWVFGMRSYVIAGEQLYTLYTQEGFWYLARLNLHDGTFHPIPTPYTFLDAPLVLGESLILRAAAPDRSMAIVRLDLHSGQWTTLRASMATLPDAALLSRPQPITFPGEMGEVHAFFYPPHNPDFRAPTGERPPLIVAGHGGPTSATAPLLRLSTQYWTSRGFAILDLNYSGSTGYGRAYRERLRGNWGLVDVSDMVDGARHLVREGLVDEQKLLIHGGSAGGFTTLAALTFHDLFTAGASYYGIGDLEALTRETHKFESHYLDSLVGPYPERRDLYIERSPIHHIERLSRPVIFFQGAEDHVVPPNQAEMMVSALKARGIPVAYLLFPGEGHGFRRETTLRRALEVELYFYGRILGFEPADAIEPVEIANLA